MVWAPALWMYAGNEFADRLAAKGARTNIPTGTSRNFGSQKSGQDGAEARRHWHPAHGRAISQQVHSGVLCCSPSEACTTGRVHQAVRARHRCRAQDRLREVHQVPAGLRRKAVACLAAGASIQGTAFSTTGASWNASNVEVTSCGLSVSCVATVRAHPSKLGMEVLRRMANHEPSAGAQVVSLCRRGAANRDGCGESLSATWATLCHARSRMALVVGGLGRGFGGENGLFPSDGATLPLSAACRLGRDAVLSARSRQRAQHLARVCGILGLWIKNLQKNTSTQTHKCGAMMCTPRHVVPTRDLFFETLHKPPACEMNAMSDMKQVVCKFTLGQRSSGALNNVLTRSENVERLVKIGIQKHQQHNCCSLPHMN